jgi:ubiquinone biosynthesis protein UbiJ
LPAPLEAQAFYADVERLRDDVERAAARLARLERGR